MLGQQDFAGCLYQFLQIDGIPDEAQIGEEIILAALLHEVPIQNPGEGIRFVGFEAWEFVFKAGGGPDIQELSQGRNPLGFAQLDEGVKMTGGELTGGGGFEVDGETFDEPAVFGVEPGMNSVGVTQMVCTFVSQGGNGFLFTAASDMFFCLEAGFMQGSAFMIGAAIFQELVEFRCDFFADLAGKCGVVLVEDDHSVFQGRIKAGGGFQFGCRPGQGAGIVFFVAEKEDLKALFGAAGLNKRVKDFHVFMVEFIEDPGGFDHLEIRRIGEDGVRTMVYELEGREFHLEADIPPGDSRDRFGVRFEGDNLVPGHLQSDPALSPESALDGNAFR